MTEKERRLARQLGDSIRAQRKRKGWSQAELAENLNISVDFIGMIERGLRLPAVPMLLRLAALFGASLDDLVLDEEDDALREAAALLRAVPRDQLPTVSAMLRGLLSAARPARSSTPRRRLLHN